MPGLRVDERVDDIHEGGDIRLRARVRKTRQPAVLACCRRYCLIGSCVKMIRYKMMDRY